MLLLMLQKASFSLTRHRCVNYTLFFILNYSEPCTFSSYIYTRSFIHFLLFALNDLKEIVEIHAALKVHDNIPEFKLVSKLH